MPYLLRDLAQYPFLKRFLRENFSNLDWIDHHSFIKSSDNKTINISSLMLATNGILGEASEAEDE
ncbi:MAG: hypothetical protein ACRD8W_07590 [Nitrososphaeraceae archaeon]